METDRQRLTALNSILLLLTLFFYNSIKANKNIYIISMKVAADTFIYKDSLVHLIEFNINNRYGLKNEFNKDYLIREFKADNDSILKIDKILYRTLENSKFPLRFNLVDSFKYFHKQYIIGQFENKEYLIINCVILKKEFQFSRFVDFNYFNLTTTMTSFEKHYTIYLPLFKDGKVGLTIRE